MVRVDLGAAQAGLGLGALLGPPLEVALRDSQNRSIRDWVRPGTRFATHIDGGKPLGFGSVKVWITSLDLADGEARRQEYRSLFGTSDAERAAREKSGLRLSAAGDAAAGPVAVFKAAIEKAYGSGKAGSFDSVASIEAFLIAARGFADDLPLHYPRRDKRPDPDGNNYEWFVRNQRQNGQKLSLPDIRTDNGLPRDP